MVHWNTKANYHQYRLKHTRMKSNSTNDIYQGLNSPYTNQNNNNNNNNNSAILTTQQFSNSAPSVPSTHLTLSPSSSPSSTSPAPSRLHPTSPQSHDPLSVSRKSVSANNLLDSSKSAHNLHTYYDDSPTIKYSNDDTNHKTTNIKDDNNNNNVSSVDTDNASANLTLSPPLTPTKTPLPPSLPPLSSLPPTSEESYSLSSKSSPSVIGPLPPTPPISPHPLTSSSLILHNHSHLHASSPLLHTSMGSSGSSGSMSRTLSSNLTFHLLLVNAVCLSPFSFFLSFFLVQY